MAKGVEGEPSAHRVPEEDNRVRAGSDLSTQYLAEPDKPPRPRHALHPDAPEILPVIKRREGEPLPR